MKGNDQKPLQSIPHQTEIEIKDDIIYLTACVYKTAQRESQKNSLFTVDCHQTILNKANKSLKTIRKKEHTTDPLPWNGW